MIEIKLSRNKDKIDRRELGRLEFGNVCTANKRGSGWIVFDAYRSNDFIETSIFQWG